MGTMLALQLTRPSPSSPPILSLTTLPKPEIRPGYLLIRIHASAIHPSDLINASGSFPLTTFPRIPGRDYAGVVVAGSDEMMNKHVYGTSGNTQAFTTDGAQAQYLLVPEEAVAVKPSNLTFAQAATIGVPFTTASLILKKSNVRKGETVLVLGANGAVGSAAVQLARAVGAVVLRGVRGDAGDVNTASDPSLSTLDTLTKGKGVDIVIDTVGQPSLTAAAITKLSRGGRLAFIAAPRSGSTELGIEMTSFYRKENTLVGVNTLLYSVEEFAEELNTMTPLFESGKLKLEEGGWNEVPLENAVGTYEKARGRGAGKFVILME